ncbi:hypothetical protein ACIPEQ_03975 [Curtobacterium sp. NPDC087080]|uniref:hypothetical protein n=1 Tax=Curtobacterium sp. NPDC087080 TaxID=3363965 RepID=UPI0038203CB5
MRSQLNVVDHPILVDGALLVLVLAHAVLTWLTPLPDIWEPLVQFDAGVQSALYLGFFGAAALVSSFAGVVIIFGLTPQSIRWQRFRVEAGESLARNWTSTSASGFIGAGLALAAGVAALSGGAWLAPWLFELGIGLVAHSSVRLIFLMRKLVDVIRGDDVEAVRKADNRPASEAPWNRNASAQD